MVNVPLESEEQQTKFMKNTKKFYKKSSRPIFHSSDEVATSTADSRGGENSLVVETNPPAIAIVAPTARNPSATINHKQPCKAHSQSSQHTRIINMPIHHPPPTPQVSVYIEPAFNFGPGFLEIPQYCPTHSRPHENQHIVLFHVSPGIAVSFQIAGIQKIFQGESTLYITISFSFFIAIAMPHHSPTGR